MTHVRLSHQVIEYVGAKTHLKMVKWVVGMFYKPKMSTAYESLFSFPFRLSTRFVNLHVLKTACTIQAFLHRKLAIIPFEDNKL